ncbi:1-aminocyclopropane-1-carboxylate synthase 2-like, partial [Impatiens glandulifera]|uniref:1-aminocyclopropane-1-carboxylate synthase 2-like n=1 Tax=Impatiens glandulifera TaxID=253017 RepID=UPI001FB08FAE
LSNPSNPLGTVLNISALKSLLSFVTQKNIHLVCDEIYDGTVFKKPRFVSVSEALHQTEGVNKNLVHIIYGLSKDLGLTGFRVGIVYSYNDYVVNSARKMSSFGLVSTQTQYLIASMLLDDDFVDGFLDENVKRLGSRHKLFIEGLMEDGIKCLERNAGLFCWMDLRHMLKGGTTQEEISLWQVIINQVKLNISQGSSFHCSEPRWFRVCFANIDNETVKIAQKRFGKFVRDDRVNKERDLKIATK